MSGGNGGLSKIGADYFIKKVGSMEWSYGDVNARALVTVLFSAVFTPVVQAVEREVADRQMLVVSNAGTGSP